MAPHLEANRVRNAMFGLLAGHQGLPCASACIGMILFVAGWSLMWAAALQVLTFVPIPVCPLLMLAGLAALKRSFHSEPLLIDERLDKLPHDLRAPMTDPRCSIWQFTSGAAP